jgi:hypothetical protein
VFFAVRRNPEPPKGAQQNKAGLILSYRGYAATRSLVMDEKEKSPGTTGIWDSANQARDIHLALMLALASAAFADGWEALRPRVTAGKQDEPECEPEETADRKKAAAS